MGAVAMAIDEGVDIGQEIRALEEAIELEGYDDALLEQAEAVLSNVFHTFESGSSSPSHIFSGRPRSGMLRLKICSRKWTKLVHASATRRAQFSRPLIDNIDFQNSRIVRIVNELSEDHICWIRHVFMPVGIAKAEYGKRYQALFWADYAQTLPRGTRLDRHMLQRMSEVLVLTFSSWHADYLIQSEPLWDVFGMSKSNWHHRYGHHWRAMERSMTLHHRRCLMAVLNRC